jgi:hypothetical protein
MIELFFLIGALTSIVITVFLIGLFTEDSVNKKYSYSEIVKLSKINLITFIIQAILLLIVVGIVSNYYPFNTALWMLCLFIFGTLILMTLAYNLFKSTRLYKLDCFFRSKCKWDYKVNGKPHTLYCFQEVTDHEKSWLLMLESDAYVTKTQRLLITSNYYKMLDEAKKYYSQAHHSDITLTETDVYFYKNTHE